MKRNGNEKENTNIDVITYHEKHPKLASRAIATNFGVGRTQIQNILKCKNELKTEYEENQLSTRKRRLHTTENDDISKVHLGMV